MALGKPRKHKNPAVINDADYPINWTNPDGTRGKCPIYSVWLDLMTRCTDADYKLKQTGYKDVSVCTEWLSFMNFRQWVLQQNYSGNHLDKDLLVVGNKLYSPNTCLFIPQKINNFIVGDNGRGDFMTGVVWHKRVKKFMASCRNPINGGRCHIGYFTDEIEAHLAWKAKKHEYACMLAETVVDDRIKNALITRYV